MSKKPYDIPQDYDLTGYQYGHRYLRSYVVSYAFNEAEFGTTRLASFLFHKAIKTIELYGTVRIQIAFFVQRPETLV